MILMEDRHCLLAWVIDGMNKTGIPLVGYNGKTWVPGGGHDDVGIYYFIPALARSFNLSLDQAISLFFNGMIFGSFLLGLLGCFLAFKNTLSRMGSAVGLVILTLIPIKLGDIYTIQSCVTIALIPLFLYLIRNRTISTPLLVFVFGAGLLAGTSNYIRIHAGSPVLLFIGIVTLFYLRGFFKKKVILLSLLFLGIGVPTFFFNHLMDHRDEFLLKQSVDKGYLGRQHSTWHTIYLSFGFLHNKYVTGEGDRASNEKVKSIDPTAVYASPRYEAILKKEVFQLIKAHPYFVIRTLWAKLGILLMYLLVFANVGLTFAFRYPKHPALEAAFWSALAFNALFGLVAIPYHFYLLGFFAFGVIYGVASFDQAVNHGFFRKVHHQRSR
ncbi:MAG: hypothetical protein LHV69_05365 [Elusimicrobia bacterium]|nr:hypothetical protein [Candidatus Obscuribacterium magneticum]